MVADPARNCFYTLTDKNTVSIYQPTTDKYVQHVQTLSNLYKAAQDKIPGSPALTPQTFQIISLHPIDPAESRSGAQLQLMALTTNGIRLYFSPSAGFGYYGQSSTGTGVRALQLQHVRLPPLNLLHPDEQQNPHRTPLSTFNTTHVPSQNQSRPYIVSLLDNSCYADGLLIAAQAGETDGTDFLLCMSPDLSRIGSLEQVNPLPAVPQNNYYLGQTAGAGPSRPPLTEYATLLAIPGRTWAMAPHPRNVSPRTSAGTPAPGVTNELATQFVEAPRQFMILTNVGLTFLVKRRALDYLKAVIEELQSEGNVQPIIEFRDRQADFFAFFLL